MPTDFNIEALIEQENSFVHANSVDSASPIHKVVTSCLEWERNGDPFVVRGVPLSGDPESPFRGPMAESWLKSLSSTRGRGQSSLRV